MKKEILFPADSADHRRVLWLNYQRQSAGTKKRNIFFLHTVNRSIAKVQMKPKSRKQLAAGRNT